MSETEQDKPTSATPAPEASQPAAAPESEQIAQTSPEEALNAAKKEAADNYARYLRSVADLENFRKRTLREKDELRQFAASRVLEDLLLRGLLGLRGVGRGRHREAAAAEGGGERRAEVGVVVGEQQGRRARRLAHGR